MKKPHIMALDWKVKMAAFLLVIAAYSVVVDLYESAHVKQLVEASGAVLGTLILGILMVFRTNTANDRWWEGRKLWGQLTNDTRTFCIKIALYLKDAPQYRQQLAQLLVAYPVALKEHLRGGIHLNELPGFEAETINPAHVPLALTERIYAVLNSIKKEGLIDQGDQQVIDFHARAFMDICGACERIKSSPIVASYRLILRQGVALNVLALPWYLSPDFHLWSIPVILLYSYFLIAIEMVAETIEEPFSVGRDKLALDSYCKNIANSVEQVLGQSKTAT